MWGLTLSLEAWHFRSPNALIVQFMPKAVGLSRDLCESESLDDQTACVMNCTMQYVGGQVLETCFYPGDQWADLGVCRGVTEIGAR